MARVGTIPTLEGEVSSHPQGGSSLLRVSTLRDSML